MKLKKTKLNKEKKETLWLILAMMGFIFGGLLEIGVFGESNLKVSFYGLLMFLFFIIFISLNKTLKDKYFTSKAFSTGITRGRIKVGMYVVIFPEDYFKKENFWKAYFMYIISRVSLLTSGYLLIKFIISFIIK